MTYEELREEWESEKDYLICHTSGSTGKPKEICLPKEIIVDSAKRTIDFFNIDNHSFLYSCISPDFIGGKMMMIRSIIANTGLGWEKPSNQPLKDYKGKEITLLSVVPSQMLFILNNLDSLPKIHNILIGGAPIPSSLRRRIAKSGINAYESYGMTETASHIALRKVEEDQKPFKTLSGISVSSADGALRIKIGETLTLTTNDAAEILSPNEFNILGRIDNVIISGGKKIYPEEIEKKLSSYIDSPFFISSLPDEKWGEKIVLVIESKIDKEKLTAICSKVLEPHQKPKEILTFPKLILTDSGKLKRILPK